MTNETEAVRTVKMMTDVINGQGRILFDNGTMQFFQCVPKEIALEIARLTGEVSRLAERNAELEGLAKYCDLLTHKLITCGVAASHPDAGLSKRGHYGGQWDSPMAQEVRALRDKADVLGRRLIEAEQFRSLARWVMNSAGHGINSSQQRQGEKLMDFINSLTQPEADQTALAPAKKVD